ncbi:Hypothetical predicted protein [Mytilus galloprovincialis]|uniref:C-type lectin domain-containing protein n=1 Tax=Mytilus galloprovincialis TaxID=29158 RepID=A0A8B6F4C4_MYTGA|nr:Hypothetical predicted protein [Mytilus galloprovincialis]
MILKDDFYERIRRATTDVIMDSHCTSKFTAFNKKCYTIVHKKLSWSQANEECSKVNGNLVTIKSLGEQKFVNELISSVSFEETARVWIGLSRHPQNPSIFNWVDGTNVSYENWYKMKGWDDYNPDEPNNEDVRDRMIFFLTFTLLLYDSCYKFV